MSRDLLSLVVVSVHPETSGTPAAELKNSKSTILTSAPPGGRKGITTWLIPVKRVASVAPPLLSLDSCLIPPGGGQGTDLGPSTSHVPAILRLLHHLLFQVTEDICPPASSPRVSVGDGRQTPSASDGSLSFHSRLQTLALQFSGHGRLRNTDGSRGAPEDVGLKAAVLMRSRASLSVPSRNIHRTFNVSDCLTCSGSGGAPLETMLMLCKCCSKSTSTSR